MAIVTEIEKNHTSSFIFTHSCVCSYYLLLVDWECHATVADFVVGFERELDNSDYVGSVSSVKAVRVVNPCHPAQLAKLVNPAVL